MIPDDRILEPDYESTEADYIQASQEIPDLMNLLKNCKDKYESLSHAYKLGERLAVTYSYLYNLNIEDSVGLCNWVKIYLDSKRYTNAVDGLERAYNNEMPKMPEQKDQDSNQTP